ncbi:peptide/nickel transport system substrate-binding protein [Tessaracoccus bendigoensis DSM 12906]|uniref:Peptide/nickel transport system substrate-binding protein n=1 Tax=Tessaracoccus bendigoensis DSM 12906 TaxID=1123357 RepID=A0A1M6JSP4_9ACTN|nr:ABC transporter substrate-binding protein [Tessaracoccus bendigoensis]SHJ49754.1 peptide/nickel transport system substrate-binding protein [Tessaracoccus bendigoensis DSM 12906]
MSKTTSRGLALLAGGLSAVLLAGCAQTTPGETTGSPGPSADSITIGTTDKVTSIDPAGSYDNGSFFVMNQVYGFLMNTVPGSTDMTPQPDLAESGEFTDPSTYTVKLKPGLKFANGNDLTSSDVKFSFDRQITIADPNGPSSLLGNLDSVNAPDDTTVEFKLKVPNDQIFPQVLTSPVGPIVDEESFPADKTLADADIVAAKPWSGQYGISTYNFNQLIAYEANGDYQGLLGAPKTASVNEKFYADASNMKLDIEQNNIDVAHRSLSATDIESLRGNDKVTVEEGPGGEIRYLVYNFTTMPFGTGAADADPAKATAVRQAMASLIDRSAVSEQVYKDTYQPLFAHIADGFTGSDEQLKPLYGDGEGGPSVDAAKKALTDAGITDPVALNIQYSPDHYGPSSGDEYAMYKAQLEEGGLFTVNLQSTEWVQYSKDRSSDVYPLYQLGWFPDFSDADNYLTPFFTKENFLGNHYDNAEVQALITAQATEPDATKREELIKQIQDILAVDLPTLPLLQGKQFAFAAQGVTGAGETLDASFKFRIGVLAK